MVRKVPRTIAVLDPSNKYLSHCTWNRALKLLQSGRAVRINATTVRLKQTKKERVKKKHDIIAEANRICYICNTRIPDDEVATIDHVIPKSVDNRADTYSNMRCCCNRCNNDKGNMTLSQYVKHMWKNREKYSYITDKRMSYLKNFAQYYEEDFYSQMSVHTEDFKPPYKNSSNKKRKRGRK